MKEELLCDIGEASRYPLENLQDHFNDITSEHSFLDVLSNELHTIKDWLYEHMYINENLWAQFYRAGQARRSNIDSYLHANQRFLQLLAVLMYWTSNLPSRRKELIEIS